MPYFYQIKSRQCLSNYILAITCFFSVPAFTQAVDDVLVRKNNKGYDVEIKFFIPLRYQSHFPVNSGNTLEIQLRPENFVNLQLPDRIDERSNLSWDIGTGIPLRELIFDGELAENPSLIFRFTEHVKFKVRNSPDLRSIIVSVITSKSKKITITDRAAIISSENLITALKKSDPKLADLLDKANRAMLDKNYRRAVQLLTKIRDESNDKVRRHTQELLGVAREYNNQLAHAKAEYQQYLEEYPEGEDAKRVKQRLITLMTAAETPKEKLRGGRRQRARDGTEWDTQFYGSFSQIYFRDETTPEDEESQLIRSDLTNDLDFVGRARKGDYDLRTQFIGSYREDLRSESTEGGEFLPSIMTIEGRHSGAGLYARLGRQSRTTGGVLGRFDGIHASYELGLVVTLNTVLGYPVDTTDRTKINTDQEFYGVSADISSLWTGWDFNAFYITQDNAGINDREAVGGEIRYFDSTKSLFTLVDYDVAYSDLNIFLLIGNWTVVKGTTLNLVLDYRNSPILTTTNAIQGQGVEELSELTGLFSEDELNELAEDRTADSQSATLGLTQHLSEKWQFIGELTVSEFSETEASSGVEAIPGTGKEYFYSTQLIGNGLFYENDIVILGLRYSDTFNADTYSINGNWRININRKLRLNPRMRIDYREEKEGDDSRWLARPFLRMDYRFKKWMKFEMDVGYEWLDEAFGGESQKTTGYFLSVGYRAQF